MSISCDSVLMPLRLLPSATRVLAKSSVGKKIIGLRSDVFLKTGVSEGKALGVKENIKK